MRSLALAGGIALGVLVAGCSLAINTDGRHCDSSEQCDADQFCDFQRAEPICVEGERCTNVCTTAGSTSCDGDILSTCERGADGCLDLVDTDCNETEQICSDDPPPAACVDGCTNQCIEGLRQCADAEIQICSMQTWDCTDWSPETDCSTTGEVCREVMTIPTCVPPCLGDCMQWEHRCVGDVREVCNDDGTGCIDWTVDRDCAVTQQTCDAATNDCVGQCVPECAQHSYRCEGAVPQECTEISGPAPCYQWSSWPDCAESGRVCDDSGGVPLCVCESWCPEWATRCNGQFVQTCLLQANGCLEWTDGPDCAATSDLCQNGACCSTPCPVDEYCNEGICESVWVSFAASSYWMGSDTDDPNEQPRHEVTIPAFEMTRFEVTLRQYQACEDAGSCSPLEGTADECSHVNGRPDQPANCVTWQQASDFCVWRGGRLPSEAEWEHAARSEGQDREYPWGGGTFPDCTLAGMLDSASGVGGCGSGGTQPVGSFPGGATDQGLMDMAGNVEEWVHDWYHGSYDGAPTDGSAWDVEDPVTPWRVVRGGGYLAAQSNLRTRKRAYYSPTTHSAPVGFRCVK